MEARSTRASSTRGRGYFYAPKVLADDGSPELARYERAMKRIFR